VTKQNKAKTKPKKNTSATPNDGFDLREFIQWLSGLHSDCLEYGNKFDEPLKSYYRSAVHSSFFAIGISFLYFLLMLFGSIFSLQPITEFSHNISPLITFVISWATSFVFQIAKKALKPEQEEIEH